MSRFYRQGCGTFVLCLLLSELAGGAPGADPPDGPKTRRWQSNLSIGRVSTNRIGIVKSFWWFALPDVIALGLSFDHVLEAIPISVDVALSAPIPIVRPFVCAGAGVALNGSSITHYGGGITVRLVKKFGIVAEFRQYSYNVIETHYPRVWRKASASYFGAGISWTY